MKVCPLNDMVVLREVKPGVTRGGIVIPDSDRQEKCVRGEVLAVGPGRWNERVLGNVERAPVKGTENEWITHAGDRLPVNVKPGDLVLFERGIGGGYEVSIDGEKLFFTREACIVAKLEPEVT